MGIKEKLQKTIEAERERVKAEQEKLKAEDVKHRSNLDRGKKNFSVLANLLRELSDAVGSRYCKCKIEEVSASIILGTPKDRIKWDSDDGGRVLFIKIRGNGGAAGYFVDIEDKLLSSSDYDANNYCFSNEDVMETLLAVIGKGVALLQHQDGSRDS